MYVQYTTTMIIAAQRHRNMGPTGDAYFRELLLLRARVRQPQDRRHAVRRGRGSARDGPAVAHGIQDTGKTLLAGRPP